MATSVVMPALEMAQETGKLVKWYKREGEAVAKGDLLMAIETDKAVIDLEAEASGILGGVRAKEEDVVEVGQIIAWLLAPGEAPPDEATETISGRQSTGQAARTGPPAPAQRSAGAEDRARLSPKARRLAAERGVDISSVRGSGPGGAVVAADLEGAAVTSPVTGRIWQIMAERVAASWTSVPHFFLNRDVDATALSSARVQLSAGSAGGSGQVTITDVLVTLVAGALKKHPRLNASWVDGAVRYHSDINVGIAVAVEQGLVVPVIHNADHLPVSAIAERRRELVSRAQNDRLQPADLANGRVTISNLGMFGVDSFSAIVNAPQAAILAVGRIADRVVVQEGQAVVCPRMSLTLSCDHRVVDGARGAAFLRDLVEAIEHVTA